METEHSSTPGQFLQAPFQSASHPMAVPADTIPSPSLRNGFAFSRISYKQSRVECTEPDDDPLRTTILRLTPVVCCVYPLIAGSDRGLAGRRLWHPPRGAPGALPVRGCSRTFEGAATCGGTSSPAGAPRSGTAGPRGTPPSAAFPPAGLHAVALGAAWRHRIAVPVCVCLISLLPFDMR